MAKSPYKIPHGSSFHEAADHAIRAQAIELLKNLSGTAEGDVEALHDMRVASRRLRAAMSVFAPAYDAKQFRAVEKQVAEVTDALGNVRDADVLLEYLEKTAEQFSEADRVGIDALADSRRADREVDRKVLLRDLAKLEKSGFADAVADLTGGPLEAEEEETNG